MQVISQDMIALDRRFDEWTETSEQMLGRVTDYMKDGLEKLESSQRKNPQLGSAVVSQRMLARRASPKRRNPFKRLNVKPRRISPEDAAESSATNSRGSGREIIPFSIETKPSIAFHSSLLDFSCQFSLRLSFNFPLLNRRREGPVVAAVSSCYKLKEMKLTFLAIGYPKNENGVCNDNHRGRPVR